MKNYFLDLLEFEKWANESVLAWMESHPENPEMVKTFAHLIAENHPWTYLLRAEQVPNDVNPVPNWTRAECRANLEPTINALIAFVQSCENFDRAIQSPGRDGVIFENSVTEILTALLNHAEHHRGQILWMIEKETGEYVPSLYMSYLRKVKPKPTPSSWPSL